jgi:hypothetical protein
VRFDLHQGTQLAHNYRERCGDRLVSRLSGITHSHDWEKTAAMTQFQLYLLIVPVVVFVLVSAACWWRATH